MATKQAKRATIYLDPDLHRAVKIKAGLSSVTISELISEAIRDSLREDAADIKALESSKNEPSVSLEDVLKEFNLERLLK
ncbi:CopG family transcriptional regulator [Rubritalea profundi]|uniref:CopG family transcriptional regulator n=1 Tax=Rubritalea profundi TaxID=1658618 RepID=A0A2S7U0L6_9BACT|nr:CopG family transcriptional regulator [Rubritalea profundi]PQJ28548.1 CopG family transcriptional regulator [Rubritalea profundi]